MSVDLENPKFATIRDAVEFSKALRQLSPEEFASYASPENEALYVAAFTDLAESQKIQASMLEAFVIQVAGFEIQLLATAATELAESLKEAEIPAEEVHAEEG